MAGGGFGAGAFAVTQYFMAKMNHEMKLAQSKLIDGIKINRRHSRGLLYDHEPRIDRTDYDCFYLCDACGFLGTDGRQECPSCGKRAWIDLGDNRMAEALRAFEERQRRRVPTWVRRIVGALYGVLVVAAGVLGGLSTGDLWVGLVLPLAALPVAIVLYFLTMRVWAVALERLRNKRPTRWRLPVPLADLRGRALRESEGHARGEALLRAPFTGRPCLGYKAMILFDVAGDARPPEWVLAEVVASDFRAGDLHVQADHALIDTEPELLDLVQLASDFDLERFLRERGLYAFDGDFFLYEARVEPGDKVRVSVYEGARPTAVVRAA